MSILQEVRKVSDAHYVLPKVGDMRVDVHAFLSETLFAQTNEELWRQAASAAATTSRAASCTSVFRACTRASWPTVTSAAPVGEEGRGDPASWREGHRRPRRSLRTPVHSGRRAIPRQR